MKKKKWPKLCSARPEFVSLSEADIWAAVDNDSAGEHPVTAEVARLAAEFLTAFKIYVDQNGFKPEAMDVPVRCPIEGIAVEMVIAFVQAQAGSARAGKKK
jgi:hypothetical protein